MPDTQPWIPTVLYNTKLFQKLFTNLGRQQTLDCLTQAFHMCPNIMLESDTVLQDITTSPF